MDLFVSGVKQNDLDVEVFEKKIEWYFQISKKWHIFEFIIVVYSEDNIRKEVIVM